MGKPQKGAVVGNRRLLMILLIVLGIAFIALAIYYWVTPAGSLLAFVPGHVAGSAHIHVKHGIAAMFAGVACLLGAWMLTGKQENVQRADA